MRRWIIRIAVALVALVLAAGVFFYFRYIRLPQPQISSAAGQPAPDFTLTDQDGHAVELASLRGENVLLMFYRGYW